MISLSQNYKYNHKIMPYERQKDRHRRQQDRSHSHSHHRYDRQRQQQRRHYGRDHRDRDRYDRHHYDRGRQHEYPRNYRRSRSRSKERSYERERGYDKDRNYDKERSYDRERPSRQSRPIQTYEQFHQEQQQHKIRQAIRNNTINYDISLHESFMKLPQEVRQQLVEQAQSQPKINQCILVRELYVSGLSDSSEQSVRQFFSKYGQIEQVQIIKSFIFVKFYKVEDATNACADYHTINTTLHQSHNSNFKMFFADNMKRYSVVSNSPMYEIKEHLIPVLYASVKNDPNFTNQQYLHSVFSKFGFIRNLKVKRSELPSNRVYVLIEFETLKMALRARDRLKHMKDKLGDRRSQITILIDNDKITKLYPNINNQLRYQRKKEATTITLGINNQPNPSLNPSLTMPVYDPNYYQQSQQQQQQQQSQQQQQQMQPNVNQNDDIYEVLNQMVQKEQQEEQHVQSDWVGFFTRNKQMKVQVDFYRIHKEPFQLDMVLNVSHRADLRQGLARTDYSLAGKFKASNSSNVQAFNGYINYFIKKQRAGIIYTNKYLIYLVPALPELNLPYHINSDELLALFFKIN